MRAYTKYRNYDFQNSFLVLLVIGWILFWKTYTNLNPVGTDGKPTSFLNASHGILVGLQKMAKILKLFEYEYWIVKTIPFEQNG